MASHNRKDLTIRALGSADRFTRQAGHVPSLTLYDDGSTDGTVEAIRNLFPSANVLEGDGSSFWAASMAQAEASVLSAESTEDEDFLVWLNDDVKLDDDFITRMSRVLTTQPDAIIVGAMRDPLTLSVTYSGFARRGIHPLGLKMVQPGSDPQDILTFNGNLVIVRVKTARELGGIDGSFAHGLADIDYGFRAERLHIRRVLAPGTYGECPRNPAVPDSSISSDWKRFLSRKGGGHYQSMKKILSKGNPYSWRIFVAITYVLWWCRRLRRECIERARTLHTT